MPRHLRVLLCFLLFSATLWGVSPPKPPAVSVAYRHGSFLVAALNPPVPTGPSGFDQVSTSIFDRVQTSHMGDSMYVLRIRSTVTSPVLSGATRSGRLAVDD